MKKKTSRKNTKLRIQFASKKKKLKIDLRFKMALRKQPDRRVKKKRKIEMPENLNITQRKHDIVGDLLCNYGMTGENLVREIFSYMDVSSIQGMYLCKYFFRSRNG